MRVASYRRRISRYDEALAMFIAAGDVVDQARVLNGLGVIAYAEGDVLKAKNCYEQALTIAHQQEARQLYGRTLRGLGMLSVPCTIMEKPGAITRKPW